MSDVAPKYATLKSRPDYVELIMGMSRIAGFAQGDEVPLELTGSRLLYRLSIKGPHAEVTAVVLLNDPSER